MIEMVLQSNEKFMWRYKTIAFVRCITKNHTVFPMLTYFNLMSHFYASRQKTIGLLVFSGLYKCDIELKLVKVKVYYLHLLEYHFPCIHLLINHLSHRDKQPSASVSTFSPIAFFQMMKASKEFFSVFPLPTNFSIIQNEFPAFLQIPLWKISDSIRPNPNLVAQVKPVLCQLKLLFNF